jgi:hypothetical protein
MSSVVRSILVPPHFLSRIFKRKFIKKHAGKKVIRQMLHSVCFSYLLCFPNTTAAFILKPVKIYIQSRQSLKFKTRVNVAMMTKELPNIEK